MIILTRLFNGEAIESRRLGLCEDSVLFCQNYNVTRLTETVQANPLLYKAVAQVIKEWTSSSGNGSHDGQLSPGKTRVDESSFVQVFSLI